MNFPRTRSCITIETGVEFDCLVGKHNQARNLTTGLVTFQPGAVLPYHLHPFTEAITLLRGQAAVEVQGRRHDLMPWDNVVIPPQTAHLARNLSSKEPSVFHIAMPTDNPTRTLVDPATVSAKEGVKPERVHRFQTMPRFEAGPNTEFIDFFNRDMIPNIEMSGGYALFHPGGRLPAHLHDFDESISIITGSAICVVEGKRYPLADFGTALVPRGRIHYFINESPQPMAMIWVYAGPSPERIIVDESFATEMGNPWK